MGRMPRSEKIEAAGTLVLGGSFIPGIDSCYDLRSFDGSDSLLGWEGWLPSAVFSLCQHQESFFFSRQNHKVVKNGCSEGL